MGTAFASQSAIAPGAQVAGDKVPVERSGGAKRHIDLSAFIPPGVLLTQNAANSAEFKAIALANDTGFSASPGSVEATTFRLSVGSWNNPFGTQTYSNSGLAIGFNCKAVEVGSDFRVDTGKHGLALHFNANYCDSGFSNAQGSEFSAVHIDRAGTTVIEMFRFRAGNIASGTGQHPTGEFLIDARIGVSGVRGARGCDFLGWRAGSLKDCFVASIRRNEFLFYYDDGTNYPYKNFKMVQASRFRTEFAIGMGGTADATGTDSSDNTEPQAIARFGSRPYSGTNFNASTLTLGLSNTSTDSFNAKDPMGEAILNVYTGNAVNGTKGIVLRAGGRTGQTANTANIMEVQNTSDAGATGTMTWAFTADGKLAVGSTQRVTGVGTNAFTPDWKIPGGGAPGTLTPSWLKLTDGYGGATYYVPYWAN